MERKIKFRAKHITNGAWLYGDLLQTNEGSVCIGVHGQYIDDGMHFNDMYDETPYIDEDTIGQFTGLLDKNGKEIYEGDILGCSEDNYFLNEAVIFAEGCFMVKDDYTTTPMCAIDTQDRTVIGNIHDNPSLISDKQ